MKFSKFFVLINSVMKLVESNELLSKDLLNFIELYKVRCIYILFYKKEIDLHS